MARSLRVAVHAAGHAVAKALVDLSAAIVVFGKWRWSAWWV